LSAVADHRGVHLSEAGRAQGFSLELLEQLADPRLQLGFDRSFDFLVRDRRHVVLELLELLDVRLRNEVRARGEDLPEFDVCRPELHETLAELDGLLRRDAVAVLALVFFDESAKPGFVGEVAEPVLREQTDCGSEPGEVSRSENHYRRTEQERCQTCFCEYICCRYVR